MQKIILLPLLVVTLILSGCTITVDPSTPNQTTDDIKIHVENVPESLTEHLTKPDIDETSEINDDPQTELDETTDDTIYDSQSYHIPPYNFVLDFPATWDDHIVDYEFEDWEGVGKVNTVTFGFSDQPDIFKISMLTKFQWIEHNEQQLGQFLISTTDFVYLYSHAQDAVNVDMMKKMNDLPEILSSFRLNQYHDYYQPKDLSYYNDDYGFSLSFPQNWSSYTLADDNRNWAEFHMTDNIGFGFPIQSSLFSITVYTHDQWEVVSNEDGPKPRKIAENDDYVFTYSHAQDVANDFISGRSREIEDIIGTFRISA